MSFYQSFTSARETEPDFGSLVAQLRALDASAGVQHTPGSEEYILKKATSWTLPQRNAAQNVLDTAPASSAQLSAQSEVDALRIFDKALVLTLIDALNVLRVNPTTVFSSITAAQAIQALRDKAGTL